MHFVVWSTEDEIMELPYPERVPYCTSLHKERRNFTVDTTMGPYVFLRLGVEPIFRPPHFKKVPMHSGICHFDRPKSAKGGNDAYLNAIGLKP